MKTFIFLLLFLFNIISYAAADVKPQGKVEYTITFSNAILVLRDRPFGIKDLMDEVPASVANQIKGGEVVYKESGRTKELCWMPTGDRQVVVQDEDGIGGVFSVDPPKRGAEKRHSI